MTLRLRSVSFLADARGGSPVDVTLRNVTLTQAGLTQRLPSITASKSRAASAGLFRSNSTSVPIRVTSAPYPEAFWGVTCGGGTTSSCRS
jgi:hypothetical protein